VSFNSLASSLNRKIIFLSIVFKSHRKKALLLWSMRKRRKNVNCQFSSLFNCLCITQCPLNYISLEKFLHELERT
jgi:hypothetical protein